MDDLISRQSAIDAVSHACFELRGVFGRCEDALKALPSAKPTLYGYPVEHLAMIATVLQKENLPPEKIEDVLTDFGRIVAMVRDDFEESLRRVVEQCKI